MSDSKISVVTGATGHIGNVLVRKLLSRGQRVRAFVLPGEDTSPLQGLGVEFAVGDVLDLVSLCTAFQGAQEVYHLAGIISIMPGRNTQVSRVNIEGTQNVLEAARQAASGRLVYTSSIHALSRLPHGITIDESVPFDPQHAISAYDRSKASASLCVLQAAQNGLDAVVACPTGVLGPYDYRGSEMGQVILDAMGERAQLCVDGAYDFVDVRDVADGLILAGERGRRGESYILSGERLNYRDILVMVRQATGRRLKAIQAPLSLARFAALFAPLYYRLAHVRPRLTPYALATITSNSVISCAKARRELGYAPRPLRQTIADTVQWFRENRSHLSSVLPA